MKKVFLLVSFSALVFTLSGCGTLFSDKYKTVNLSADTNDTVSVEVINARGIQRVQIPATIIVERSSDDLVINVKDNKCYENTTTQSPRKLNKWVVLNLFFGLSGFTSTTTDAASGKLWDYDDKIEVPVTKKDNCTA